MISLRAQRKGKNEKNAGDYKQQKREAIASLFMYFIALTIVQLFVLMNS